MPHKHRYDFDTSYNIFINISIKREAFITKKWLEFKFKGEEIKDCSTIENIEKIHKTIQESVFEDNLHFIYSAYFLNFFLV